MGDPAVGQLPRGTHLEVAQHDRSKVRVRQAAEGLRVEAGTRSGGGAGGVPQRPGSGLDPCMMRALTLGKFQG